MPEETKKASEELVNVGETVGAESALILILMIKENR